MNFIRPALAPVPGAALPLPFGGKVRQVAWRVGPTRVWITNTLRDDLTRQQMLALAQSCVGA